MTQRNESDPAAFTIASYYSVTPHRSVSTTQRPCDIISCALQASVMSKRSQLLSKRWKKNVIATTLIQTDSKKVKTERRKVQCQSERIVFGSIHHMGGWGARKHKRPYCERLGLLTLPVLA